MLLAVVDGHSATYDLEEISVNDNCGTLIDSDPQQIRVQRHNWSQITLTTAHVNQLFNRRIGEQPEACLVSWCHHNFAVPIGIRRSARCAAHKIRSLDRRS